MDLNKLLPPILERLNLLFEDTPTIALAGSHAKGLADDASDIDLFVFGNHPKPYAQRKALIETFCDSPDQAYVSETFDRPYGGNADFVYRSIPVEVVVRLKSQMEETVSRCLQGDFDIIPQTWTSNGYYSFIYLSELNFLKPLCDEDAWLHSLKASIRVYPPALKKRIIQVFMGRASTWIHNFHYQSAIARQDTLFIAPILIHTIMDMIQVIFAVNEVYFTGDKKLEAALRKMPYCPSDLTENLDLLLNCPKDDLLLQKQADLLARIYQDLQHHVS